MKKKLFNIFIYTLILLLSYIDTGNCSNKNSISDNKDSISFIHTLYTSFRIDTPMTFTPGKITAYDTVQINGSNSQYLFIEYTYSEGPMSDYPWKTQFLVTTDYCPVQSFHAKRYEWIEIFPDTPPFLLILNVTGKGNGYHEIYKLKDGAALNVYEGGNPENLVRTYDKHSDKDIFKPGELQLIIADYNGDGINDLIFRGKRLYNFDFSDIYNQEEEIEYIFLYDPVSDYFTRYSTCENYDEAY